VLIYTPLEAVTVTLIDVYVPAGTDRLKPTKVESVCKRDISYDVGMIGTVTTEPLEGVRLIPAMGSVKLKMETPAGGRSNIEILRCALPVLQPVEHPPFFSPLHEANSSTAADKAKRNNAFIFITHPRCHRTAGKAPVSM
jgi:hypothetical protein